MDIKKSFEILEIDTTADLTQAHQAYREKVKSCHPDQVIGDNDLKQLAGEKLKEINLAYEVVTSVLSASQNTAPGHKKTAPAPEKKPGSPKPRINAQATARINARVITKKVLDLWSSLNHALSRIDFRKFTESLKASRPRRDRPTPKPSGTPDFDQVLDDILSPGQAKPRLKKRRRRRSRRIRSRHGTPHRRPDKRPESASRISPIHRVRGINKNK
jgi:hypothetical protein